MPDQAHKPLNRQDLERVAHEALGRQLRLMVGMSALLLVLGFVVGQFTGASLARRNTERLQAQLDQMERKLEMLEHQLTEGLDEQAELEAAFIRVERQRRSEIAVDQAALEAMIGSVEAAGTSAHADLDAFDARQQMVPTGEVRGLVDRFVSEQVELLERRLASTMRRLGLPEPTEPAATIGAVPEVAPTPPVETATDEERSVTASGDELFPDAAESVRSHEELTIVEPDPVITSPRACRPRNPILADVHAGSPTTVREQRYLAPPRRRGYLFFSPTQPRRMDPDRVSESATIPLPPR